MKFLKLLLVALLAFFVACGEPSTPEEISVAATKAMANGNIDECAKYFGIEKIAKNDGEKTAIKGKLTIMVGSAQEETAKKGGLKDVKVIESTQEKEFVKVKLELSFGDGSTDKGNFTLKQYDGKWFIHNLK